MRPGVSPVTRRADAGTVRISERDIAGLIFRAEHYGIPYDLLAAALAVQPARLRGIAARWRSAGYASTGRLGPGTAWCWLTPAGMAVTGLGYPATRPALARLAHIRAVLAARLWLEDSDAWQVGRAWWRSKRRIRAALPPGVGRAHLPDAEIHWPSLDASPHAGQVWAVEAELTPHRPMEQERPDRQPSASRSPTPPSKPSLPSPTPASTATTTPQTRTNQAPPRYTH